MRREHRLEIECAGASSIWTQRRLPRGVRKKEVRQTALGSRNIFKKNHIVYGSKSIHLIANAEEKRYSQRESAAGHFWGDIWLLFWVIAEVK